jgi:hypothetical protein
VYIYKEEDVPLRPARPSRRCKGGTYHHHGQLRCKECIKLELMPQLTCPCSTCHSTVAYCGNVGVCIRRRGVRRCSMCLPRQSQLMPSMVPPGSTMHAFIESRKIEQMSTKACELCMHRIHLHH